ncbi:hypothetical protein [Massilia phyllosphaerae]|uniref:hypothetical protein n=1 Tax=Massilia phyllosphaerae TaxID=3106034 RepID=UPI002B1CAC64|nr:hypothetical protein [Massilia sp. SGZ-792]
MSHYDENNGAPGVRSTGPDDTRLPEATRAMADTDSELTALRRNLLLYGTAGQPARSRVEVHAN